MGPLFFIIFINDPPKLLSTPSLIYADDISVNNSFPMILQNDLDHDWSQIYLLYHNVKKCEVMHFGSKLQLSNKLIYFINDVTIGGTFLVNDLGVYISDLDWEDQVIKVCS